jgi:ribosomal 50S subunit-associated protein YjgA (DUF615 family)
MNEFIRQATQALGAIESSLEQMRVSRDAALAKIDRVRQIRDELAGDDEGIDEGYSLAVHLLTEALGE